MTLIIVQNNDLMWLFIQQGVLILLVSLQSIALVSWWISRRDNAKRKETDRL